MFSRVVKVGESSIVMAISSPHRKAALEAVQYAVDIVKSTVPLWKKVLLRLLSFLGFTMSENASFLHYARCLYM